MHHRGSQTATSWLLTATSGVRGSRVARCLPVVLSHLRVPAKIKHLFLIMNALPWETRPSSLTAGRKWGAIYLPDFVRAWPSSCRPLIDWKCAETGRRRRRECFRQNNSAASLPDPVGEPPSSVTPPSPVLWVPVSARGWVPLHRDGVWAQPPCRSCAPRSALTLPSRCRGMKGIAAGDRDVISCCRAARRDLLAPSPLRSSPLLCQGDPRAPAPLLGGKV